VEVVGGGRHFLRNELSCENLGVSVPECEPDWTDKPHDHAEDGQEEEEKEVYVLLDGEATVTVGPRNGTEDQSRVETNSPRHRYHRSRM